MHAHVRSDSVTHILETLELECTNRREIIFANGIPRHANITKLNTLFFMYRKTL